MPSIVYSGGHRRNNLWNAEKGQLICWDSLRENIKSKSEFESENFNKPGKFKANLSEMKK